jgi:tetrahydromethanopterin S-methyltransferase subunit E
MSFNSRLVKAGQSTIVALTGVLAGVTTGGPTLALAAAAPEPNSIVANVSVGSTTSTITIATKWQVSNDGSTWLDLKGMNAPALVAVAAAGTGSIVTTAYAQALQMNPGYPYVRLAVLSGVATGAAGDTVTISYNYIKRGD